MIGASWVAPSNAPSFTQQMPIIPIAARTDAQRGEPDIVVVQAGQTVLAPWSLGTRRIASNPDVLRPRPAGAAGERSADSDGDALRGTADESEPGTAAAAALGVGGHAADAYRIDAS
jgi:hypothetical protein